jgi:hypothetical protein
MFTNFLYFIFFGFIQQLGHTLMTMVDKPINYNGATLTLNDKESKIPRTHVKNILVTQISYCVLGGKHKGHVVQSQ